MWKKTDTKLITRWLRKKVRNYANLAERNSWSHKSQSRWSNCASLGTEKVNDEQTEQQFIAYSHMEHLRTLCDWQNAKSFYVTLSFWPELADIRVQWNISGSKFLILVSFSQARKQAVQTEKLTPKIFRKHFESAENLLGCQVKQKVAKRIQAWQRFWVNIIRVGYSMSLISSGQETMKDIPYKFVDGQDAYFVSQKVASVHVRCNPIPFTFVSISLKSLRELKFKLQAWSKVSYRVYIYFMNRMKNCFIKFFQFNIIVKVTCKNKNKFK